MIPPFISYLLASTLCLSALYVVYLLLFHRSLPIRFNRWLILGILGLGTILPLIHIPVSIPYTVQASIQPSSFETMLSPGNSALIPIIDTENLVSTSSDAGWTWTLFFAIYLAGLFVMGRNLYLKLSQVIARIHESTGIKKKGFFLLHGEASSVPHSFFRFIFVNRDFSKLPEAHQRQILTHERVHAQELHSLDILILEICHVVFWFNPILIAMKQSLREVHEYIADQETVKAHNLHEYARLVVNTAGRMPGGTLVNGFAQSLVGKRVKRLLGRRRESRRNLAFLVPIFSVFVLLFSCQYQLQPVVEQVNSEPMPQQVVEGTIEQPKEVDPLESRMKQLPAIKPVHAAIYSGFGMRMHPIHKIRKMHTGVDFEVEIGTPVHATADGVVSFTGINKGGYGIHIDILHEKTDLKTKYAHLSKLLVKEGQLVKRGEVIGFSGNSGLSKKPHLHYEVIQLGPSHEKIVNRMNPEDYFYEELKPADYQELRQRVQDEGEEEVDGSLD